MTLIVDLREVACAIEADFSHLWIPQDPRCWYRPGAFDPVISPAEAHFIRIRGEFVPIKEYRELPDTDIYNSRGLVIPRELVPTLTNTCTQPTRGIRLIQQYLSEIICNQLLNKQYQVRSTKDWYIETYLNPMLLNANNIPNSEDEKPEDILWNALQDHWYKITEFMQELANLVIQFVRVNRYCEYYECFRHTDLMLERGVDTRIEFFEKYHYLQDEIHKLHCKAQEEKEITRRD